MTDMWRNFCRHVVDIENDYFEKDGLIEDTIEEFIIELGDDSDDDDNNDTDKDMMDKDDRQLIDDFDQDFLDNVLPLS